MIDGWNGLLVGDISQPRGGPMLTGHASHQIGLDADIWLTPMPNRILTAQEREKIKRRLVVKDHKTIDTAVWTEAHAKLISAPPPIRRSSASSSIRRSRRSCAAGRPAIAHGSPRSAPITGMTIISISVSAARATRPAAGTSLRPNPADGTGCGTELAYWLRQQAVAQEAASRKTPPKPAPPMTLKALPAECRTVVMAP